MAVVFAVILVSFPITCSLRHGWHAIWSSFLPNSSITAEIVFTNGKYTERNSHQKHCRTNGFAKKKKKPQITMNGRRRYLRN